tara:strand:- start:424 stop:1299 length:876 start_codon:yes stop_codon:yes gene_type:complete
MDFITVLKNKLKVLTKVFTRSSKSKIDIKSARYEARKLMQTKSPEVVQAKSIEITPKIQLVKKISLGQSKTILVESAPEIIVLNQNNISNFEPGYVLDTNILMHFEDYPELLKNGTKLVNKLSNKPIYILSATKKEFLNKKCPADDFELIRDTTFTGKKRNFENILKQLPAAFGTDICYVNIEKCTDVNKQARKFLPDLESWGLHMADSQFLSFSHLTHSTLITCDKDLIRSCNIAKCRVIEFRSFTEKILQPSPITVRERKTRLLRKKRPSIFNSKDGRNSKNKNRGVWY